MLALLAPGQGSQKPAFLTPWLDDWPGATRGRARLRWFSALTGLDLLDLGTVGSAEDIRDTARTQPLLVAAGLVAAEALPLDEVTVVAGHSIGELTAAALAGVLTAETAVGLAAARGREMAAACAREATGMSAVLGGVEDEVLARLDEYELHAANRNGAGQIVAAGALPALEKLAAQPPTRARVVSLRVAGAFHTPYMAAAEESLAALAGGLTPEPPAHLLLSNADGAAVTTGAEAVNRIVRQVTSTVRWDLCQDALADLGVTAAIELPPAGTLTGLLRRAIKGIELVTLNTPADLPAARDLVARHGGAGSVEPVVQFHVTVATAAGTFTPAALVEGDPVAAGSQVGVVQTRQGPVPVTALHDGVLVEWLADDGDPVAPGQPLVRLHPAGATP